MDKLKKHIDENREALDRIEQPDLTKIWAGVQSALANDQSAEGQDMDLKPARKELAVVHKQRKRFTLWAVATAASFALLIGLGVGYLMKPSADISSEFDLANYAPDLVDEASNYRQLVDAKMTEINFQNIDTLAFTEILQELKELDGEYEHWTKDVPKFVHEQELLEFLQRHYEQKIRILEILSKEIEKRNHYEERSIRL